MLGSFEENATPEELAKVFGETVRKLRKQKGVSQDSFAFDCNINRTYYGHVERGRYLPTIHTVHRIAFGLGITSSELMRLVEEQWSAEHP